MKKLSVAARLKKFDKDMSNMDCDVDFLFRDFVQFVVSLGVSPRLLRDELTHVIEHNYYQCDGLYEGMEKMYDDNLDAIARLRWKHSKRMAKKVLIPRKELCIAA